MDTDNEKEQARQLEQSIAGDLNGRAVKLGKVYGFDFIRGEPDRSENAPFQWTPLQELSYYQTME